jgi:hypothetical protein
MSDTSDPAIVSPPIQYGALAMAGDVSAVTSAALVTCATDNPFAAHSCCAPWKLTVWSKWTNRCKSVARDSLDRYAVETRHKRRSSVDSADP